MKKAINKTEDFIIIDMTLKGSSPKEIGKFLNRTYQSVTVRKKELES